MNSASEQGSISWVNYYYNLINNEQYHRDTIKASWPDTYDFLLSLQDRRRNIANC